MNVELRLANVPASGNRHDGSGRSLVF